MRALGLAVTLFVSLCLATPATAQVCGNGFLDVGEACDDGNLDSGDGCDEACAVEDGWECRHFTEPSLCGTSFNNSTLVITEVMTSPDCVLDSVGEWIEIFNASGHEVDLKGWNIRSMLGSHDISDSLSIPDGAYAVLCANGDPTQNGGVDCDYVYTDLAFSRRLEYIALTSPWELLAESLLWNDDAPSPKGASVSLCAGNDESSNNYWVNWFASTTPIAGGCGDLGTPKLANPACATCEDEDSDGAEDEVCGGTDCDDADPDINPDVAEICDNNLDDDCDAMTDADDPECWVTDCGNGTIDAGEVCDDGNLENGDGCDFFCHVEDGFVCDNLMEPSLCGSPAVSGDIVIDELMVYEECQEHPDGDWIEIHNVSGHSIELKGWSVQGLYNGTIHFFESVLITNDSYAVICYGQIPHSNGGVDCDAEIGFIFNRPAGVVRFVDPEGNFVDSVGYDGGVAFPDVQGASMSLNPGIDDVGNDVGGNWCAATEPIFGGCGDLGTPGDPNPVCPVCPDNDGDSYSDDACGGDDCDDGDPDIHPGMSEDCVNGVDDDCDGLTDAADPACMVCEDQDGDGYLDEACGGDDCNDSDPDINPGFAEVCDNGVDDDCDGLTDILDGQCSENCGDGLLFGTEGCDDGNLDNFDGCSSDCEVEAGWDCATGTEPSLCGTTAAAGDLWVTEIMNNPDCVYDDDGEWIEVHNGSVQPHQLRGWTLSDDANSFVLDSDLIVTSGGYAVLCLNADAATNGSIACDATYSGFNFNNTGDSVGLTDPSGRLVDLVAYDDGVSFPSPTGASMSLDPSANATSNDLGTSWCESLAAIPGGCGDLGTPGAENPSCQADCPDQDSDGHTDQACGGDDCDDNAPAVNPSAAESCANGIDDDCDGRTDDLDPDCGAPTVCGDGLVEGLEQCDDSNDIDGDGCSASCEVEPGFACRAGTAPSLCGSAAAAGELIITEIMLDPECVTDANGEWVELYNASGRLLWLHGFSLSDGDSVSVVTEKILLDVGEIATLCSNTSTNTNGNVLCDGYMTGIRMNNSAELVLVSDPADTTIDRVEYDPTFPLVEGEAMSLMPGLTAQDNDRANAWCSAPEAIRNGCGDMGSPGRINPACPDCVDRDEDGHPDEACGGDDCDDEVASIHPGATEVCEDGIDQDCDGEDPTCPCEDLDADGHGAEACGGDDCDDADASIHPGAEEVCEDGIDQDCDGQDQECVCEDADRDGFPSSACGGQDCDDTNQLVRPGVREDCTDGIDNNCDGLIDGADAHCGGSGCACASSGGRKSGWIVLALLFALGLARRPRDFH